MPDRDPVPPDIRLPGSATAFTPVPLARKRTNGWSVVTQERFITALAAMASVGAAARAVGLSRASAYQLRARPGAESFAAAWDRALALGRDWTFAVALDRAVNGVTTVRVTRGGGVDVATGPDMRLVTSALRDWVRPAVPPRAWLD